MKYREFLGEMPIRRYPTDPELGLADKQKNSKLTEKILASSKKQLIKSYGNYRELYRWKNHYALIDMKDREIIYYLQWKQKYYKFLNSEVISETFHWKNRAVFGLSTITEYAYLDLLLPLTSIIMCDYEHTQPGENFWLRLIEAAISRKLHVYYLNMLPISSTVKRELIPITDDNDLKAIIMLNEPWGDRNANMAKRILISVKPLTLNQ
jgi:hypothetical protein